jgi:hypothetical protein
MLSLISTCVTAVLQAVYCILKIGVCSGSDLGYRTDLCNGLDFEIHSDSFETYPDNRHYSQKAEIR